LERIDNIIEALGQGASGQVVLMEHKGTKRLFAGKRIFMTTTEDKRAETEATVGMTV
jgi:hypothetical protein